MIVSFSVENFRSFADEQTFSLIATDRKSDDHQSHAIKVPGSKVSVLKAAAIYGANGAGKSSLFKALRFLRNRALDTRKKGAGTGRVAFAFGDIGEGLSTFDLQFIAGGVLYRFGIKVNDSRVVEEWLIQIRGVKETIVYERVTTEEGAVTIDGPGLKGKKLTALQTIGGQQNQTFLATVNATLDEADFGLHLGRVIKWFRYDLVLIAPNESYSGLGHRSTEDSGFVEFAGNYLRAASTGVSGLDVNKEEITEVELGQLLPKDILAKLLGDLNNSENESALMNLGDGNELLLEKSPENHFYRITIKALHKQQGDKAIPLPLSQESDGTRRLLNLLPALHDLRTCSAVYVIDEIDRSMHPMLVRKFLEFFLKTCEGGQRQIIVTTHESTLLDLDLLRRDEIWFAEKDVGGATHLYSLAEFQVRKDLEIRKHYLQGRFGAVPFLGSIDQLLEPEGRCK
jgi:AAA15 family ATPase/GTPase